MPFKSRKSSQSSKSLRNIALTLEYNGADFFGFQRQPNHPSIQEALETALSKLLNRETKITAASGRTDTGVHAAGQIVNFKTHSPRSLEEIRKALNALLPRSVAVLRAVEMPADFHARYSAKGKTYEYKIWNHEVRSTFWQGRAWHVPFTLNTAKMKQGAKILEGRHDFRSFCTTDPAKKERDTVRDLRSLKVVKKGNLITITAEANGFLYRMVRNLAGALVELGAGKMEVSSLKKVLEARSRSSAGRTAPPEGLTLVSVTY